MYSSNGQNGKKMFFSTLRHKNNSRRAQKKKKSEPENDIMAPLILGIYIRLTPCIPSLLAQQ